MERRLAAITSGGAIPDNSLYTVVAEPDGAVVGTVDEDFAVESNRGDIMLLGNTSWMIHRIETKCGADALVQDAHGAPPSVPFWRGEALSSADAGVVITARGRATSKKSATGCRACRR